MRECEHSMIDTDDQTQLVFDISRNRRTWLALTHEVKKVLNSCCIARVVKYGINSGVKPQVQGEMEKGIRTGQWMDLRVTAGDVVRGGVHHDLSSGAF